MKKCLIAIFGILVSSFCYADIISVQPFSADSTVSHLENFRTTVVNWANGNVEGSGTNGSSKNILADSIGELDMASEINPRVRDSELLGVTYDTTTSSNAYVASGLVPATATGSLTSDISAGTAYVNGYRVVKAATSQTYTANRDTYVDLSQTGTYTLSPVTIGAAAPAVAANSARIAKVTTNGTDITTVTDLANRRIPGLIIPAQYRQGMFVSKDSATTVTVFPGSLEVNNAIINKTAVTTLTTSTAGDWAGGSSLRAADTFGFVGCDSSGNLKLHTTAPTHNNYAVSVTTGKKRYATWSSVVYRIIGWFYMDGSQNLENASNIKEADVPNVVMSEDSNAVAFSGVTTYSPISRVKFYCSGNPVRLTCTISADTDSGGGWTVNQLDDATELPGSVITAFHNAAAARATPVTITDVLQRTPSQATRTYVAQAQGLTGGVVYTVRHKTHVVQEE